MFDAYIICGTPRTGSTLLCDLLASTGAAGAPDSFYGRTFMPMWAEDWRLPGPDTRNEAEFDALYLDAAIRAGKGATGIFGLRLMRENLEDLSAILDRIFPGLPSDTARLEKAFGKTLYIHLSRDDKLAQAVSLVKAQQTGLWHIAPDGSEIERLAPAEDPHYDFEQIRDAMAGLERQDSAWNRWFRQQRIDPVRVGYERLASEPAATVTRICESLGVEAPNAEQIRPGVAILSDETSRDWMRRYRSGLAAAS